MDYGLILPSLGDDANLEGIEAAVDLAAAHGFSDVWTTDHLLVNHAAAEDYGRIYEAVTTLAWAASRRRCCGSRLARRESHNLWAMNTRGSGATMRAGVPRTSTTIASNGGEFSSQTKPSISTASRSSPVFPIDPGA